MGHHIPYHRSVGLAANILGWNHIAIYPKEDKVPADIGPKWIPCLSKKGLYVNLGVGAVWLPLKLILKIYGTIYFRLNLIRFINKYKYEHEDVILFFDDPAVPQLSALISVIHIICAQNIKIWIMLRTRVGDNILRAYIFSFTYALLKRMCGSENIDFLTDSDILKRDLDRFFQGQIKVMPIPHIGISQQVRNSNASASLKKRFSKVVLCWWPGSPRIEKGLQLIENLMQELSTKESSVRLLLPFGISNKNKFPNNSINFLPEALPREQYEALMNEVDIILLPYDPREYGERTSGIFVEAIANGVITLVTEKTWMAKELEFYGIENLIIPWHSESLLQEIIRISKSNEIKKKIKLMQRQYLEKHGEFAYSKKMLEIYMK